MRQSPVIALALLLAWPAPSASAARSLSPEVPALILSEILADPAALPDAQGEFVELANPRADSVHLESVSVSVDGHSRYLGALDLAPGGCYLLCRDSAAYAGAGVRCGGAWDGMSLANSRPLEAILAWAGGGYRATLPASRAGLGWENTWDAAAGYGEFRASVAARAGGDSATPGVPGGGSGRTEAGGLFLAAIDPLPGNIQVTIGRRGDPPQAGALRLRLDADWDGSAERLLDSVPVDASGPFPLLIRLACPADARGRLEAFLGTIGNAAGESRSLALEPEGSPLAFGAFRAEAKDGEPEWLEIRNATGSSGRAARRIGLGALSLDGRPLGLKEAGLGSGDRLILTPDTAGFRARYGALKATLARPGQWRALRNTGDTVTLSACGVPADTLAWAEPGKALPAGWESGSAPEREGWSLSGRAAVPAAPLGVEVRAPAGRGYVLRAFDLEGQCVREIGRGGAGRRTLAWDGRGEGGRALPRGAYVLCLSFAGGTTRKRAVFAGER